MASPIVGSTSRISSTSSRYAPRPTNSAYALIVNHEHVFEFIKGFSLYGVAVLRTPEVISLMSRQAISKWRSGRSGQLAPMPQDKCGPHFTHHNETCNESWR